MLGMVLRMGLGAELAVGFEIGLEMVQGMLPRFEFWMVSRMGLWM